MSSLVRKICGICSNKLLGVNIITYFRVAAPTNSYFASLAFHKKWKANLLRATVPFTADQIRRNPKYAQIFLLAALINQLMRRGHKYRMEIFFTKIFLILAEQSFCLSQEFIFESIYDHYSIVGWRIRRTRRREIKIPLALNILTRHRSAVRFFRHSVFEYKTTPLQHHFLMAFKNLLIRKHATGLHMQAKFYQEIKLASKQRSKFRFQTNI